MILAEFTQWLQDVSGFAGDTQRRLLVSFMILMVLWLIRVTVLRRVWKKTDDVNIRYRWQKITSYVAFSLGFLLVGRVWLSGIESLATFLGLVTAGLAIALQDLVKGIAGWAFVLWRKPFAVGDRIQVGDFRGDVIDIRLFKFSLMEIGNWVDADQSTGRVIHLPNAMILDQVIANYSEGFEYVWEEIGVQVTFESNWQAAKTILLGISEKHGGAHGAVAERQIRESSKRFMIYYSKLTPTVYTSVRDSGILLTIRYLTEPRKRRDNAQAIWEEVLMALGARDDIDFAYPTQRFYDNSREGKVGAKLESRVQPGAGCLNQS